MGPSLITLYATFGDAEEARRISRILVAEKLVACANILGPIQSLYQWQGVLEESSEVAALFKTTQARAKAAMARIAALHSYEMPCITTWPLDAVFPPYAQWVSETVGEG